MKIPDPSARQVSGLIRLPAPEPGRRPANAPTASGRDVADPATTVELSARARELHDALRLARAAPDVRTDLVDDIRHRIADGRYDVDAGATAQRMIDRRA